MTASDQALYKPSIAIISNQAFSLINFRGSLINKLFNSGYRVWCLAPDFNEGLRQKIFELGGMPVDFDISRTGMNPFRDILDALKLAALLRKLKPKTTLTYFIKPVIYGTFGAWLAKVPHRVAMVEGLGYIFTNDENDRLPFKRKLLQNAVLILYKLAFKLSHRVILLNTDDISFLVGSNILSASKVSHLDGIGIDLKEWALRPPVLNPICFLLAARLLKQKGIVEFAMAAKTIRVTYPAARFIVLGGLDPNPSGLKLSEINKLVVECGIEWHGHVSVKEWLENASVFVLPSYYREGLPRSILEAMALGKPIITTDSPGCRETVREEFNGYLIPIRNSDALIGAMEKFIINPDLISKMGSQSRLIAEERFDVNKINDLLLKILKADDLTFK